MTYRTYFFCCRGSRHARAKWALSTLYRTHRRYGPLFVRRNRSDVLPLDVRQRRVSEVRIRLVPIETRKVLLQPRLFKYLAVAGVDLLPHLARVFEEQALEQCARDRLRAQLLMNLVLVLNDRLDVDLVVARECFILEVLVSRVPGLEREVLLQPVCVEHTPVPRIDFISQQA